jgi:hypothetical protein
MIFAGIVGDPSAVVPEGKLLGIERYLNSVVIESAEISFSGDHVVEASFQVDVLRNEYRVY